MREVQLVDALEVGGLVILVAARDVAAVAAATGGVDEIGRRHFFVDTNVRRILFFVEVI